MNYGSWINNKFTSAANAQPLRLINPATEQVFQELPEATVNQVEVAVAGAKKAFKTGWRDLSPGKRTEILFRVAALIRTNLEALAKLETENAGKPISDSRDEIGLGARVFEYYAGAITKFFGQTIPVWRGGFDFTIRQSLGVVAAITPWNFPFPIACWKVAPALAAGNCVVLKPAEVTPLTALRLAEICAEAGLPEGVLQVLPGSGSVVGEALVQHPEVRKVSFTGSTKVGKRIMALAANDLKRVSLELGGKSPNIVFADADLEQAAAASPMSVFANAGQDCCARSRMFVEKSIFERFIEKFVQATSAIIVGDPNDPGTQMGPLISAKQRDTVQSYIRGINSRCSIACGGKWESRGYFVRPTVVLGSDPGDAIWQEEVFGPVVCIRPFTSEEQMLEEVNASPYGLSGSIWTNDLKRALRLTRRVESGVLSINSHSSVHVEAPFGGFKQSGLGRDLGMAALEGYTEIKNVYVAD